MFILGDTPEKSSSLENVFSELLGLKLANPDMYLGASRIPYTALRTHEL